MIWFGPSPVLMHRCLHNMITPCTLIIMLQKVPLHKVERLNQPNPANQRHGFELDCLGCGFGPSASKDWYMHEIGTLWPINVSTGKL